MVVCLLPGTYRETLVKLALVHSARGLTVTWRALTPGTVSISGGVDVPFHPARAYSTSQRRLRTACLLQPSPLRASRTLAALCPVGALLCSAVLWLIGGWRGSLPRPLAQWQCERLWWGVRVERYTGAVYGNMWKHTDEYFLGEAGALYTQWTDVDGVWAHGFW